MLDFLHQRNRLCSFEEKESVHESRSMPDMSDAKVIISFEVTGVTFVA